MRHQLRTDPKLMRANMQKQKKMAEACMPCAAGAYIQQLRQTFSGGKR